MKDLFQKIALVGVGLIGGSLAKALLNQQPSLQIVGVDHLADALAQAKALGVIHQSALLTDLEQLQLVLSDADLIVLAVPMKQMISVIQQLAPFLSDRVVLTDVGSTKFALTKQLPTILKQKMKQFVPAHPIAGLEKNGVASSLPDLFIGCHVILCPDQHTDQQALSLVKKMWQSVGAQVALMGAQQHDEIFSAVSHLPHVLAFALLEHILRSNQATTKLHFTGSGFRDFTRIAAAEPQLWTDICLENKEALLNDLQEYIAVLSELSQAIECVDADKLLTVFKRAKEAREFAQRDFKKVDKLIK